MSASAAASEAGRGVGSSIQATAGTTVGSNPLPPSEDWPAASGPAVEELSGDLDLFGLPTLLQSMAESELTGRLTIAERNGRDRAVLFLSAGKIARCDVGRLSGTDAVCQLFERPKPGTFRFEHTPTDEAAAQGQKPLDVMSTIMEAMRRDDEFQRDRAIVPDGSSLNNR